MRNILVIPLIGIALAFPASAAPVKRAEPVNMSPGVYTTCTGNCLPPISVTPPPETSIQSPVTIQIDGATITVEGGTFVIGPEGKVYKGGKITITGGTVTFDPAQKKDR